MTYAFVGHRGVGKSSLMKRLKAQSKNVKWIDLDHEIQAQHGVLQDLIAEKGEAYFREIEFDVFKALFRLYGEQKSVFVLGAGFPMEKVPDQLKVIWIRRKTDCEGRVFLDRPRLNKNLSAWEESMELFKNRDHLYAQRCDFFYDIPEGLYESSQVESDIFRSLGILDGASADLNKNFFFSLPAEKLSARSADLFKSFQGHLEFLSSDWNLKSLLKNLEGFGYPTFSNETSNKGNLLSLRDGQFSDLLAPEKQSLLKYFQWVDVDLKFFDETKLGSALQEKQIILSSHEDKIDESLRAFSSKDRKKFHFKLCPLIENWDDFNKGYLWWKNDPANRSYLPRSKNGQWAWYRKWISNHQKINFALGFHQNVPDQATLYEILSMSDQPSSRFAAVLGEPIRHSQSPQFHYDFFNKYKIPYLAVSVKESEFEKAFGYLTQMGLRFASITSPLKRKVYRWVPEKSTEAHSSQAVNTLTYKESSQSWAGDQTDLKGLQNNLSNLEYNSKSVCVWGGGGVLELLKVLFPQGEFYAARQAPDHPSDKKISLLIWAAPRSPDVQWPPKEWQPELILDLNYSDSSMGKEYAALSKAKYNSGLDFFKEQALEQQKIWKGFL